MKFIHIICGLLALASGAVALYATKGAWLHRKSGMIFAGAMLVMSSTGAAMAAFGSPPNRISVVAGVLTFYLVSTGLLTMQRTVEQSRKLLASFMLIALTGSAFALAFGVQALNSVDGKLDGLPPQPMFMFAVVGLLAALGDARTLWVGSIQGAQRLARHLWRMSYAMWVATMSFFLGQAQHFPEVIRHSGLLVVPVILVLLVMLYWLLRVLVFKRRASISLATPPSSPAR